MQKARPYLLPDLLAPDLKVIFCGSALGAMSYRLQAPYANPATPPPPILLMPTGNPAILQSPGQSARRGEAVWVSGLSTPCARRVAPCPCDAALRPHAWSARGLRALTAPALSSPDRNYVMAAIPADGCSALLGCAARSRMAI